MNLSDFIYDLPIERIASYPARPRDSSRLMVIAPGGPPLNERFRALPRLLRAGDLLVLNETRVLKARLLGRTEGGGKGEVLLLKPAADGLWEAMVKPGKRLRAGKRIHFGRDGEGLQMASQGSDGIRLVRSLDGPVEELMERWGSTPLPPYIPRQAEPADERRYQTIFARQGASVAAPTAGLHFTARVLNALGAAGVRAARIRLDVGLGTFKPVTAERVEDHKMAREPYEISREAAAAINGAIREGRRVVAVGTTVTRCLEDQILRFGEIRAGRGETDLFILPGFKFRAISGLLTNFHLPGSTLLMLACAFAGRGAILAAYSEAVSKGYRFYSYGDAMLLWKKGAREARGAEASLEFTV